MRNGGVHWFHLWRVFPSLADADGNITFTAQIDGEDVGKLKSSTLQTAIDEVKNMIEKMMNEAQK